MTVLMGEVDKPANSMNERPIFTGAGGLVTVHHNGIDRCLADAHGYVIDEIVR